jgi:methylthioribose-1-phosphate isomerase
VAVTRGAAAPVVALRFDDGVLRALDQTRLPWSETELKLSHVDQVVDAIRRLAIRGAPLIGVAAAYGVALGLRADPAQIGPVCEKLVAARPTAINLRYAVDRVRGAVDQAAPEERAGLALAEAQAIEAEEERASAAMAAHGAALLAGRRRVLTHCNTGALAAPGRGTALAVIAELADRGQLDLVLAAESRPLLQGARLTVYELRRLGLPHALVVDGAAAGLIAAGRVDAVVVGCDRVAANGDVANKVGTYAHALAASAAGIPFMVAGPTSTIDLEAPDGPSIEIEQRDESEVREMVGGPDGSARAVTLPGTPVVNPAFDVTPSALITALVTERGAISPARGESVRSLVDGPAGDLEPS